MRTLLKSPVLVAVLIVGTLVLCALLLGSRYPYSPSVKPVDTEIVQHGHGCAIRLLPTGPVLLRDSAHHCNDHFTAVSVSPTGDLDITYHVQGKIVVVNVTPDETLAKRDVTPGVSVGLEHMYVSFGRDQVAYSALSPVVTGSSSNIWVWVVTEEEVVAPSPTPTGP